MPRLNVYRVKKALVREGEELAAEGDTVYEYKGHDYGLTREDTTGLGVKHVSVTKNKDGSLPFFTIPEDDLQRTGERIF